MEDLEIDDEIKLQTLMQATFDFAVLFGMICIDCACIENEQPDQIKKESFLLLDKCLKILGKHIKGFIEDKVNQKFYG